MSFRKLRYFVAIAEHGSFTQAARTLNIAQSALSRQIRETEAEIGMKLFYRNGRGVSLTSAGLFFLGKSKTILADVENFNEAIARFKRGSEGPISIGMPAVIAQSFIQPLVERIKVDLPGLELRFTEGSSGFVEENLASGKVDVGVFYRLDHRQDRFTEVLCHENLLLAQAVSWTDGPGGPVELSYLRTLPMILPTRNHPLRRLVESYLPELVVTLEIDSLQTIKDLVISGHGCSILPRIGVYRELQAGNIKVMPIQNSIERTLLVAMSGPGPYSANVGIVYNEIIRHAGEMRAAGYLA